MDARLINIIDLDNCIADDEWRIKYIDWSKTNADDRYDLYHKLAPYDDHRPLNNKGIYDGSQMNIVLTARPSSIREETLLWLDKRAGIQVDFLVMRNPGEFRHSRELKVEMLKTLMFEVGFDKSQVYAAYDDRLDVLEAFVEHGLLDKSQIMRRAIHDTCAYTPPSKVRSVPELLHSAAETYQQRNAVYGDNYKMVGPLMKVLFPNGVPPELLHSDHFHLFELKLVKLSRFAVSGLRHRDSIHDDGVYSAMIESILSQGGAR